MNELIKCLVFQNTNTQRVTITKNPNGSWLLSKEWRHNTNENWVQGKGITIPQQYAQSIGELLISKDTNDVISKYGFEYLETEGVEKGDFNKNYKQSTNNWKKTYAHYRKQNPVGRHIPKVY